MALESNFQAEALARKDLDRAEQRMLRQSRMRIHAVHGQFKDALEQVLKREDLDEKSKAAIRKAIERKRPQSGGTNKKPDAR